MKNSEWNSYDSEREIKFLTYSEGAVIKPKTKGAIVPLFCEVCEFTMKTAEDYVSFKTYQCCSRCELVFARPNSEKWLSESKPWRPDKTSPRYLEYINTRLQQDKPQIKLK